ncbi:nucleobase-ascorbate transporter 12 [Tanacetum coccineum]
MSDPNTRPKPDDSPPIPPSSWAKRTGFRPRFSGETNATDSGPISRPPVPPPVTPPATPPVAPPPTPPVSTTTAPVNGTEVKPEVKKNGGSVRLPVKNGGGGGAVEMPAATTVTASAPAQARERVVRNGDVENALPQLVDDEFVSRNTHMKYELRDTPGLVPIGFYGFQHYLSMLGSLVLIPLVIVPAMGGDHEDMSNVVSTVLFVSGMTTLLQANFGSRLPLIQGPSFVFLAPALAIIKSPEFIGLNGNNFKHIMKELQGTIIIASAFQALLGYSGLMTLLLRFINPVVVSPTIAAVGLSFYSYGFPQMGACLEIGMVQILLVIMFSLYLRKVSILGHRVFLIYAVPLGLALTWAMSFLLTEAGAYKYDGCDVNIPTSNMLSDHCRRHVNRMKSCRADTSHALNSSPWFRFPYPLQWGTPVFNWKMVIVMCVVSVIASVDSVGSYHASSLLVASRPPTPGVVSRGIGLEGLCSILAGLWGTGAGSTTLTENVHTIAVTKMGSRKAVELGACVLIVLSLVGKVGGFIASIPQVMVAGLLCIMWAMLAALGLSNLRYSEAGSSRNIIIIGLSLFFSLSVPAYFQQYGLTPNSNSPVPIYFQPYVVASHGPFRSQYGGLNYVMNTVLSFHMVIAFLVAVILDNTVPGSRQERGVYVWSEAEAARREPAVAKDYGLPFRVGKMFRWVRWVGL